MPKVAAKKKSGTSSSTTSPVTPGPTIPPTTARSEESAPVSEVQVKRIGAQSREPSYSLDKFFDDYDFAKDMLLLIVESIPRRREVCDLEMVSHALFGVVNHLDSMVERLSDATSEVSS